MKLTTIFWLCFIFETTASTISHCIFELAHNQDVQERLHQELSQSLSDLEPETELYFERINGGIPFLEVIYILLIGRFVI